jgi:phage-related protein
VVVVLKPCRRELLLLPPDVRGDLADALARLDGGLKLSVPLSRPMPAIGMGAHELRLKDRSGQYRVIYAILKHGTIYVVHAFKKTTEATPRHSIELAQQRLREVK